MRGELLNYEDLKDIDKKQKYWIEEKYHGSALYEIYKSGLMFYISRCENNICISTSILSSELKLRIKDNIMKIYEWISFEEYIDRKLNILKLEIDLSLEHRNQSLFNKLSKDYDFYMKLLKTN